MKKRDYTAVAVVVILAMMAGLWAVKVGLDRAVENQNAVMQQAISNVGELPVDAENAPPLEDESPEVKPPEDPAPLPDEGESGSSSDDAVVSKSELLAEALATGDFSSAEVLIALGLLDPESRPSMGDVEITLESLVQWMQTESMGALAAKAALQGAQTIAAGGGRVDDAQLRAFAKSQGSANYQADCNRLEEQALDLGLNYLRLRDELLIREELLAFYLSLEQSMQSLLAVHDETLEQLQQQLDQEILRKLQEKEETKSPEDQDDLKTQDGSSENASEGEIEEESESTTDNETSEGSKDAAGDETAEAFEDAADDETAEDSGDTADDAMLEDSGAIVGDEGEEGSGDERDKEADEENAEEFMKKISPYVSLVSEDLAMLAQVIEQARADVEQCKSDLNTAMQLILLAVGNFADQTLFFTGELVVKDLPTTTVEEAVKRALANRNEVKAAAFAIVRAEELLTQLKYQYAPGSLEILNQQAAIQTAQADYLTLLEEIELEIRDRYDEVVKLTEALSKEMPGTAQQGLPEDSRDNENDTVEGQGEADRTGEDVDPERDTGENSETTQISADAYVLTLDEDLKWSSNVLQLLQQWTQYSTDRINRIEQTVTLHRSLVCLEHAIDVGTAFVTIA